MLLPDAIRWTLILWLTVLGGCIGSFLNVVIYRLPRRQSLMHPGSRCPHCGHAIRWRHNLPVVGWWMLKGHCFDCGESIAARYPIVEAMVACWFGALAWYGPIGVPGEPPLDIDSIWGIYGYHLLLCCLLLCLLLIDGDSQSDRLVQYPTTLWWVALGIGVSAPFFDPTVHPIAIGRSPNGWQGLIGALCGLLVGSACRPFYRGNDRSLPGANRGTRQLVLIGAFLGWIAALAIGIAAVTVALVARRRGGKQGDGRLPARYASAMMLIGVTIWVLTWKQLRGLL